MDLYTCQYLRCRLCESFWILPYESFKEELSLLLPDSPHHITPHPSASGQTLIEANAWPHVLSPELINTATHPKGRPLLWAGGTWLKSIAFLSSWMWPGCPAHFFCFWCLLGSLTPLVNHSSRASFLLCFSCTTLHGGYISFSFLSLWLGLPQRTPHNTD